MPRAGWCDVDNAWVWLNDDGSCQNGHGSEHVSRVYDADPRYPVARPVPMDQATGQENPPYYTQSEFGTMPRDRSYISLALGIASILCCIPIVSLPAAVAGLVFGIQSLKGPKRGLAIAGIVLSGIGLAASIVNASLGAYWGLTGQNELVNQLLQQ